MKKLLILMIVFVIGCQQPKFDGRYFVSTEGIVGCGVESARLNFEFESDNSYYLFTEKRNWVGLKINKNYSQSYQQPEQVITICKNQNQENGNCVDEIMTTTIGCDWCYYFKEINKSIEQREQGGIECLSPQDLQVIDLLKEKYN